MLQVAEPKHQETLRNFSENAGFVTGQDSQAVFKQIALEERGLKIKTNLTHNGQNDVYETEEEKRRKRYYTTAMAEADTFKSVEVGVLNIDFFEKTKQGISTLAVTNEEISMNEYFRDETGNVKPPDALKNIARQNGLSEDEIDKLDKDGFATELRKFNPEAALRITSRSDITKMQMDNGEGGILDELKRDAQPFSSPRSSENDWNRVPEDPQPITNPSGRSSAARSEIIAKANAGVSFDVARTGTPLTAPTYSGMTQGYGLKSPALSLNNFAPSPPTMAG